MPARRLPLRALLSVLSARARTRATLALSLGAAAKVVTVVGAVRVADGNGRDAAVLGIVVLVLYALRRAVAASARVAAHCDVHRAFSRAVLEGDVVDVPERDAFLLLYEGSFELSKLVSDVAPELVSDLLAALCVAPLLARSVTPRALAVLSVALLVVVLVVAAVRALVRRLEEAWVRAQEELGTRAVAIVSGRLEIVARGAEEEAERMLDHALARYSVAARRATWASGLLGRAALAAGFAAAVVCVLVDAATREALWSARLHDSLVLASVLPIAFGALQASSGVGQARVRIAPLGDVLARARRADVGGGGKAPPSLPARIEAKEVSFAYAEGAPPVLDCVSFVWPAGRVLLLEGPNGSGKSTLLRLVLGLRPPDSGTITLAGSPLATLDLRALRRNVAYLPQRTYLGEPSMSVRQSMSLFQVDASEADMLRALARTGFDSSPDALDVPIGELSTGQRQRVALARMLLADAAVVLLDEPDANLDREGVAMVVRLVEQLVADGKMVAVAAHGAELGALDAVRVELSASRRAGTPA